ncbi:hypothetical protein LCGC14_1798860 [marine sediment metagenome]|uniref:Uncharacterized protein n=1 Tax=marine sediment metagenome TaxID=412755 RepID=A0A0F9GQ63_9ZZZZ
MHSQEIVGTGSIDLTNLHDDVEIIDHDFTIKNIKNWMNNFRSQ